MSEQETNEGQETNEQTLGTFYQHCDMIHRELFSVMIRDWQEAGLDWCFAGRSLALGTHSVRKNQMLHFFYLNPGEHIYQASISIDLDDWRELLGQEETENFLRDIKLIHGMKHKKRDQTFSIDDPGHLSGPQQQQLRDLVKRLGLRLPELVAS